MNNHSISKTLKGCLESLHESREEYHFAKNRSHPEGIHHNGSSNTWSPVYLVEVANRTSATATHVDGITCFACFAIAFDTCVHLDGSASHNGHWSCWWNLEQGTINTPLMSFQEDNRLVGDSIVDIAHWHSICWEVGQRNLKWEETIAWRVRQLTMHHLSWSIELM